MITAKTPTQDTAYLHGHYIHFSVMDTIFTARGQLGSLYLEPGPGGVFIVHRGPVSITNLHLGAFVRINTLHRTTFPLVRPLTLSETSPSSRV